MKAEIKVRYGDRLSPHILASALKPDNYANGRLTIKTWIKGKELNFCLSSKSLGTLIPMMDDLLQCLSAGEKILRSIKGDKRSSRF